MVSINFLSAKTSKLDFLFQKNVITNVNLTESLITKCQLHCVSQCLYRNLNHVAELFVNMFPPQ